METLLFTSITFKNMKEDILYIYECPKRDIIIYRIKVKDILYVKHTHDLAFSPVPDVDPEFRFGYTRKRKISRLQKSLHF